MCKWQTVARHDQHRLNLYQTTNSIKLNEDTTVTAAYPCKLASSAFKNDDAPLGRQHLARTNQSLIGQHQLLFNKQRIASSSKPAKQQRIIVFCLRAREHLSHHFGFSLQIWLHLAWRAVLDFALIAATARLSYQVEMMRHENASFFIQSARQEKTPTRHHPEWEWCTTWRCWLNCKFCEFDSARVNNAPGAINRPYLLLHSRLFWCSCSHWLALFVSETESVCFVVLFYQPYRCHQELLNF